ncbi:hypothetical protein MIND_01192500 [Mycena indigotica]|uniref:DUF6699 domain-containing protein n=1 Tax=Mycena indigotica TaxID=2126181 RepID=A0A8H6VT42_9AGAR|nr:uncharacterized protein MIND_01192500 [Mycena indigotica]KAF7292934.1 hypothetical protein MIND_01192500 [Mycena indigotica]
MNDPQRRRRLPTPHSVRYTRYADFPFVPPVRAPLEPTTPSPYLVNMPSRPLPGISLSAPSALGWREHVLGHHHDQPTPATTPVWPTTPMTPLDSGHVTLPAETNAWVPGTFPPQPFGTPVPLHVHPNLILNPMNPTLPVLQWDLLHAPEQARLFTGRGIFKKLGKSISEAVVFPDASTVWVCADPESSAGSAAILGYWMEVWGPIIIEKASGSVKILELLDAVRDYFQAPLTNADITLIRQSSSPINPKPLVTLKTAAYRRADDAYELRDISTRSFRRIDVLGMFRQWGGVRPMVFQDGSWRLFLTLLPYAVPRR